MARAFRHGGRGSKTRETVWFQVTETRTTSASANTATLVTTLNAAALAFRPFTVIRTHMTLFVSSDQTGAGENYDVGYGSCVVSDQAAAIGITAVPTPFTDLGSDLWFLHQIMPRLRQTDLLSLSL